jgi:RHS repeat-associated protein
VGSVKGAGGTITYLLRDHLSPRVYTNSSGKYIGDRGHYPFGEVWYNTYIGASNWFFTSYERDQESQLDYALARSYSNSLGRFMAPDVVAGRAANPQSWNRYVYVLDDPIDGTDPSGNCWPPSACAQAFMSQVNNIQARIDNWAIGTGNPYIAGTVSFTAGMTATVVNGVADTLTVGDSSGAVWDSGDGTQRLLAAAQDMGKTGSLILLMAGPATSAVEAIESAPTDPNILSGHGIFDPANGTTTVPNGTSVTLPTGVGPSGPLTTISDTYGNAIETGGDVTAFAGQPYGMNAGAMSYLSGSEMPNMTLLPPGDCPELR